MDPRDAVNKIFDINKIDYDWVKNNTNKKELNKAMKALQIDGGFPDLEKAIHNRLCEVDPNYKRLNDAKNVSEQEIRRAKNEIEEFGSQMDKKEARLKAGSNMIINEKEAELEKQKGNECIRSKEYDKAINYYEKGLKLNPNDASIYFNRSLAYHKKKEFVKSIADCDSAIALKSDYLKAFFRRGECFFSIENWEKAYEDFYYVSHIDSSNQEALKKVELIKEKFNEKNIPIPNIDINKILENLKAKSNERPKKEDIPTKVIKQEFKEKKEESNGEGSFRIPIIEEENQSENSNKSTKIEEQKNSLISEENHKENPLNVVTKTVKNSTPIWEENEVAKNMNEIENKKQNEEHLQKLFAEYENNKEIASKNYHNGLYD